MHLFVYEPEGITSEFLMPAAMWQQIERRGRVGLRAEANVPPMSDRGQVLTVEELRANPLRCRALEDWIQRREDAAEPRHWLLEPNRALHVVGDIE